MALGQYSNQQTCRKGLPKLIVSGFTIARNVVRADYPIKEAVFSVLPLVDEMVIAVGKSDDNTLEFIQSFESEKIKIIETVWDDNLRKGGEVLAIETNKAKTACRPDADWLIYIQADECLHEKDYPEIREAMERNTKQKIDGLLFNYTHFYGSYDYIGDSRKWYRNEIRIIKNNKEISSYKDAQGFRKNNEKLLVKKLNANVYHYGWVKHPDAQQAKQMQFHRMWHSDEYMEQKIAANTFNYEGIDSLAKFTHTHPDIMQNRIKKMNWQFDFDISKKNFSFKNRILYYIEKIFGWRVGEYKNYKLIEN